MARNIKSPVQLIRGKYADYTTAMQKNNGDIADGALYYAKDMHSIVIGNDDEISKPYIIPTAYQLDGKNYFNDIEYFISANGDDSNSGMSPEEPVRTFKEVLYRIQCVSQNGMTTIINFMTDIDETDNLKTYAQNGTISLRNMVLCFRGYKEKHEFKGLYALLIEHVVLYLENIKVTQGNVYDNLPKNDGFIYGKSSTLLIYSSDIEVYQANNAIQLSHSMLLLNSCTIDAYAELAAILSLNFCNLYINNQSYFNSPYRVTHYVLKLIDNSFGWIDTAVLGTVTGHRYALSYGSVLGSNGHGAYVMVGTEDGITETGGMLY